jgi:hydroxymethylbilane synthase
VRLATRGSPLALWQAEHVKAQLNTDVELVIVETTGDRRQDVSIEVLGGQGVFVKEVQLAVLDGRADAAVHSAKDLPSTTAEGLVLAALTQRGDPRDALVGSTLDGLQPRATVATGSVRRRAQLAHMRPDLQFADLRGNIATRLKKADGFDAIVMAVAALERLGQHERIAEALDPDVIVPQVSQGAIGVECRADDAATQKTLQAIDHGPTRWAVEAERAFLATLGSGCTLPVGAYATKERGLVGVICSPDGSVVVRDRSNGEDSTTLGRSLAEHLLDIGGRQILRGK